MPIKGTWIQNGMYEMIYGNRHTREDTRASQPANASGEAASHAVNPLASPLQGQFKSYRNLYDVGDDRPSLQSEMRQQDGEIMEEVQEHAFRVMPCLRDKYEGGWPVDVYLRTALKPHGRGMTPVQQRKCNQASYKYHGKPIVIASTELRENLRVCSDSVVCLRGPTRYYSGSEYSDSEDDARLSDHIQQGCDATPPSGLDPHVYRYNESSVTMSSNTNAPSSSSPSPSRSSTRPAASASRTASWSDSRFGSMPSQRRLAPPPLDQPLVGLLRAYALPPQDVEHLVGLLASLSVSDMDYLRLLSRMASTDSWLREMREQGQLSEIQLRLLREILERVADSE
ncbi:hypothetical protein DICSQDRAFT_125344 [Dichomitus squalens LYAD-421 SS1]|uniref:uncharacterized protein n=1 Tax=Dichomitus squalens (strain LYAD-421) TaxID=732165 RepID=UPI00044124F9|nr:uncharacterized protein DICSQDRAFT_125344 [Dichomitus squalens LYAD-421 SS1]EJF64363.1 hypothetical protein DICSQDRAFT_125344 [Dichomitus squalens LYAD-421 SS1]